MNIQDSRQVLAESSEIGVYEVRHLIGSDRLSLTYKAWNHHLNAPVLLREFYPSGLARRSSDGIRVEAVSDTERERYANGLSEFLYEAERLAEIEQVSVNKVLNALEFNDTGYQVISLEQGQSLSVWIESAYSFKEDQLQVIFETLLGGLKAVHEHGLVHGRICPENILLRDNCVPVLINFPAGLLQFARDEGLLADELREGYAPVEQYQSDHLPAPADDLYALGATLYRCITHRSPLSAFDRLNLIRNGNEDPMAQSVIASGSETPAPWIKAVDWMLRPKAKDRPQKVSEIEKFLAEFSTKPRQSRQPSGSEKSKLDWTRMALTGKRLSIAAAIFLVCLAGILSVRTFQTPNLVSSRHFGADHSREKESDAGMRKPAFPAPGRAGIPSGDSKSGGAFMSADQSLFESSLKTPDIASLADFENVLESAGPPPGDSASAAHGFREAESIELMVAKSEPLASSESEPVAPEASHEKRSVPLAAREPDPRSLTIAGHLKAAERNLAAFNLTTPAEDNAYSNFQAVLELDPDNQEAHSGIDKIMKRYVWLIRSSLQRGRIRNAEIYLARAETIMAGSPELESVRSKLEETRKSP
jgi:serine/threonine protein kinase